MLLAEETVNGFAERLIRLLGNEGTDSRFGARHAYRFKFTLEIVEVETGEVVEERSTSEVSSSGAIGKSGSIAVARSEKLIAGIRTSRRCLPYWPTAPVAAAGVCP